MTQHIASRAQRLQPSPTLAVSSQAKAMRAQGHPVISLAAGEPDLATPEVVIKAAQRALEAGATRYTPVKGIPKLCAAIADDSKRARQVACDPEREVIVTVGAKQALFNAFQVLLEPGDEVLLPLPSWVSYAPQVELAGGVAVPVAGRAEPRILSVDRGAGASGKRSQPFAGAHVSEQPDGLSRAAISGRSCVPLGGEPRAHHHQR